MKDHWWTREELIRKMFSSPWKHCRAFNEYHNGSSIVRRIIAVDHRLWLIQEQRDVNVMYRVLQKKPHNVLNVINLETFAVKWRFLYQNDQRRLLCINQRKIFVNGLNILCLIAGSGYTSAPRCAVAQIDTHICDISHLAYKMFLISSNCQNLLQAVLTFSPYLQISALNCRYL